MNIKLKLGGLTTLISMAFFTGCQTNCDPSQGGLVDGISCLSSGNYEQRVQQRNANLEALKAQNQSQDASNKSLDSEAAFLAKNINMQKNDLNQLSNNIDSLHQKITKLHNDKKLDEQKLSAFNSRMSKLENQTEVAVSDDLPVTTEGLSELSTKKSALQKEYDELLQMYLELDQ